jgi:hypothetical protein
VSNVNVSECLDGRRSGEEEDGGMCNPIKRFKNLLIIIHFYFTICTYPHSSLMVDGSREKSVHNLYMIEAHSVNNA